MSKTVSPAHAQTRDRRGPCGAGHPLEKGTRQAAQLCQATSGLAHCLHCSCSPLFTRIAPNTASVLKPLNVASPVFLTCQSPVPAFESLFLLPFLRSSLAWLILTSASCPWASTLLI